MSLPYNCEIVLNGKKFKFEDIEEEPLLFQMTLTDEYYLIRDINCDIPFERLVLYRKYVSVENSVPKDDEFSSQVYYGKVIDNGFFMKALLEHLLYQIV